MNNNLNNLITATEARNLRKDYFAKFEEDCKKQARSAFADICGMIRDAAMKGESSIRTHQPFLLQSRTKVYLFSMLKEAGFSIFEADEKITW